jgi:hypothetical protein
VARFIAPMEEVLERRIPADATLTQELPAWQSERKASHAQVKWRFATAEARLKLPHFYTLNLD